MVDRASDMENYFSASTDYTLMYEDLLVVVESVEFDGNEQEENFHLFDEEKSNQCIEYLKAVEFHFT